MKEKFNFVYDSMVQTFNDLRSKKITVEQAKASASLAKQMNNVLAVQMDAAKFMANVKESVWHLEQVGLCEKEETPTPPTNEK